VWKQLLFFYCGLCWAGERDVRTLTILHTNDLHARLLPNDAKLGGFAHIATILRQQRQGCTDCLTLDAGDLVQGSPVSTIFKGVPCYEVANTFGIDVSTLGNHEWDYGHANIAQFIATAKFDIVNANVRGAGGGGITRQPWVVKKVNGLRVGIIGVLMNDLLENYSTAANLGPYKTIPAVTAIRGHVKKLRKKADLIVVLAHTSDEEAEQIAREIPEVSVVIGGHIHGNLPELRRAGNAVLARARGYGVEVGRLEIAYDKRERKLVRSGWKKFAVDSRTVAAAPDTAQLVASWEGRVAELVEAPIAEARRDFTKEEMRQLIERAMKAELGVDFAYMNLGGVRELFRTGTLRKRHVWNLMPFDNIMVMGKFKGKQLPEAVRRNQTNDQTIDPEREYTFAVTDFTASSDSTPGRPGSWELVFPTRGPLLRDLLLTWVEKTKVIE
jgi:5'-nucleotidase / UDP-sugar diphosphatase